MTLSIRPSPPPLAVCDVSSPSCTLADVLGFCCAVECNTLVRFVFFCFCFLFLIFFLGGGFSKDSRGKRAREGSANKLKPHMHVGVSPQFHSSIFTLAPDLSRRARASTDQHKKRVLCCCLTTASVLPKL